MIYKAILSIFVSFSLISSVYGLSGTEVFKKVNKSVVLVGILKEKDISKLKKNLVAYGSAVAVRHNIVATNCHVVLTGKHIIVIKNNSHSYATIMAINKSQDLCLLKVNKLTLVPVNVRPTADIVQGEDVYSIGNPGVKNYLSKGIISNVYKNRDGIWIMTDTATSYGSSGGGLFDDEGNLIGITTTIRKANPNISTSASIDWVIQKLKLYPVFKNPKKTPIPDKDSKHKNTLEILGKYGDSRIVLYKYGNGCFIYFPGRTASGRITSAAIWFPGNRKLIFIYPSSRNISHVIKMHGKHHNKNRAYDKDFQKSNHILSLDKKFYSLYYQGKFSYTDTILVAPFSENPTMVFAEGDKFVVYIKDPKVKGGYQIRTFGLWGFSKALVNYNAKCLNQPDT